MSEVLCIPHRTAGINLAVKPVITSCRTLIYANGINIIKKAASSDEPKFLVGHTSQVLHLELVNVGEQKNLFSASQNEIVLWNLQKQWVIATEKAQNDYINKFVAISPDKKFTFIAKQNLKNFSILLITVKEIHTLKTISEFEFNAGDQQIESLKFIVKNAPNELDTYFICFFGAISAKISKINIDNLSTKPQWIPLTGAPKLCRILDIHFSSSTHFLFVCQGHTCLFQGSIADDAATVLKKIAMVDPASQPLCFAASEGLIHVAIASGNLLVYNEDLTFSKRIELLEDQRITTMQLLDPGIFFVVADTGRCLVYDDNKKSQSTLLDLRSSTFTSMDIFEDKKCQVLALGDVAGNVHFYDGKSMTRVKLLKVFSEEITNLKFAKDAQFLVVSSAKGGIKFVDAGTYQIIPHNDSETLLSKERIEKILLSDCSKYLIYAQSDNVVSMFWLKQANSDLVEALLIGRIRNENCACNFGTEIFVYCNEEKSTRFACYNYEECVFREFKPPDENPDQLVTDIEMTRCEVLRPDLTEVKHLALYRENSEPFLAAFETSHKIRLISLSNLVSRRLLRIPHVDGQFFWRKLIQQKDLSVMTIDNRVYLARGALVGNPYQYLGQTVSGGKIRECALTNDGFLYILGSCGELTSWKVNEKLINHQIATGGALPEPYYAALGGRHSKAFAVVEACFVHFQADRFVRRFSQGTPKIERSVPVKCVGDILDALGIFLAPGDAQCLHNELAFERSGDFGEFNDQDANVERRVKEAQTATIDKVLQCIANYQYSDGDAYLKKMVNIYERHCGSKAEFSQNALKIIDKAVENESEKLKASK